MDHLHHGGHEDGDGRAGSTSPKYRHGTTLTGQQSSPSRLSVSGRSSAHVTPHTSASFERTSQQSGYSSRESIDSSLGGNDRNTVSQFGMGASAFDTRVVSSPKAHKVTPSMAPKSPTKPTPSSTERAKGFAMRFEDHVHSDDPTTLFDLKERLGKGSFGSVFRAVNRKTGEVVAVKIIPVADDESIEDVRREVSILQECENSHIVKYYGAYFQAENLWVRSLNANFCTFSNTLADFIST